MPSGIKYFCFILILHFFSVTVAKSQQSTKLRRSLHLASYDSVRVRLYTKLAEYYYMNGKTDSSIFFAQKGISLSQKIKMLTRQAELYRRLGANSRSKGNLNEALDFFTKSKKIAVLLNQNAEIEKTGYNLAQIHAALGNYKASVREIIKNLDFAERHKSNIASNSNYLLLADLNMRFGNDSLSHYYLRKSWQVVTLAQLDNRERIMMKINMLMDGIFTNLDGGRYESADKVVKTLQQMEGSIPLNQRAFYITAIEDVALAYMNHNLDEKALELFEYMIAYIKKKQLYMKNYLEYMIYPMITKIYLKQNKFSQAVSLHNKSRMLIYPADSLKDLNNVYSILRNIAILHNESVILEKNGQYKKALAHLHTLEALKQNLNQKRKDIEFIQVSALIELEANKHKIERLNNQVKIQNLSIENDERRRMFLLMLVFLLILVCAMIFIFLRHANREQKLLFEQKVKIEAQSKELEDANQIKDKLFSIIGHDLRSPVADLLTTLDVANNLKPDKMKQYMFKMKDKIRYVYDVIDNLLNWSVIQLNTRQAPMKLLNFKEAIRETIGLLESTAHKKNITIINQVEDNSGYANEHKLQVIFRNILSNAIKFTPVDGFIRIYSVNQKELTGIAIKDSGMGLDSNILHNIYSNLESKPGTSGEKGTGLGLRLSRELIEKQGGAMKIISQAGNGTLVKLYFKKQPEPELHS